MGVGMQALRCEEIIRAVNGILVSGSADIELRGVSTDSRKIAAGDLFVPIAGERFDGHDFIGAALEKGAAAAITHKETEIAEGRTIIKVGDTLKALGDLARYYRQKFRIPVVAVTGSVGKTSTKDMISCVLSQQYHVLKTEGNFNNEIGLPLTVFHLDASHEAAVLEMGMSGFGEISRLTRMACPDVAVITNIGIAHIEKLGSRQNILKAKMEVVEGLHKDGLLVLNGDDKLLYGVKDFLQYRMVFYGMEEGLDYQAYNVRTAGESGAYFDITLGNRDYAVHVPVPGVHNIYNALAAIAAGMELKIPADRIVEGIAGFSPGRMRLNIISRGGLKIINDAYNASPQSMEAALDVLRDIGGNKRTVAVLGDMLEMGDWAPQAHRDVGRYAAVRGIQVVTAVGENGENIAKGALEAGISPENIFTFPGNKEVNAFLESFLKSGDVVLVKGSRGMKMEQIVEKLEHRKE